MPLEKVIWFCGSELKVWYRNETIIKYCLFMYILVHRGYALLTFLEVMNEEFKLQKGTVYSNCV